MLGAIWQKLKTGLARTRDLFTGVAGLFRLKGRVDEAFWPSWRNGFFRPTWAPW